MTSSSISGAHRTDSTSESWLQSYAKSQSVDPTSAGGSVLFESLFTAEFFRSSMPSQEDKGAELATEDSSSCGVTSQEDSEDQIASESQASNTDDTEQSYEKCLFGGPRLNDQKNNQPAVLTKKRDDKKDSKEQNAPTTIVPYCPPPAFSPSNTHQAKDPTQSATITKNPDVERTATNELAPRDVKNGPAGQDTTIGLQNEQNTVGSGSDAKQGAVTQQSKPEEIHQDNKSAIETTSSQQESTAPVQLASQEHSSVKSEQRPNQLASNEHGEKVKSQQSERADAHQDKDEGDRPQNRRAERLEENRVDQKKDPINADISNQTSQTNDQSPVQDQSQVQDLIAEMTVTSPSADVTLAEALSAVPSADASTVASGLTDFASMAAAGAITSASAITASVTSAIPASASVTSAVAASSDGSAASSLGGASAVAQSAVLSKAVSSDTSTAASQGSTPVSAEPLTEYQQSRLMQRVLKGLERLDDNSSTIRLRLHPPELGALEMSLHVNQQQLSASINVESDATRQVLQDNLPQLQSKLAERGITLDKFDIQVQSTSSTDNQGSSFNQQQPGFGGGGSWSGEPGQGRGFGEARWNQIRPQPVESSDASQSSSHLSRYYSGQNLNLHA